jgi:hypothetical protein
MITTSALSEITQYCLPCLHQFHDTFGTRNRSSADCHISKTGTCGFASRRWLAEQFEADPMQSQGTSHQYPAADRAGRTGGDTHPPAIPTSSEVRIDKSALILSEPKRLRDPEHLKFIVRHGCVICGKNRVHAHHLTFAQPNALGKKVSDEFTVPLCPTHHRELHHAGNEKGWWQEKGIDPAQLARNLWQASRKDRSAGRSVNTQHD